MAAKERLNGIDLIRYAARLFSDCREDFNQRFTTSQLLQLAEACRDSDWDFYPDQWSERQIQEALSHGRAPTWEADQVGDYVPTYDERPLAKA